MKDQIISGTGNSRYLKSSVPANTTFEQFLTMLRNGTLPIDLNGINLNGITELGTSLSKANLLSDDTTQAFFCDSKDYTVNDVLKALANGTRYNTTEEIVSSQQWTCPTNIEVDENGKAEVEVTVFGGGGGGSGGTTNYSGGGGGSGEMARKYVKLTPGTTYTITIGAGGNAGSSGGTTSFGNLISASGGERASGVTPGRGFAGGGAGNNTAQNATGASGGNAMPCTIYYSAIDTSAYYFITGGAGGGGTSNTSSYVAGNGGTTSGYGFSGGGGGASQGALGYQDAAKEGYGCNGGGNGTTKEQYGKSGSRGISLLFPYSLQVCLFWGIPFPDSYMSISSKACAYGGKATGKGGGGGGGFLSNGGSSTALGGGGGGGYLASGGATSGGCGGGGGGFGYWATGGAGVSGGGGGGGYGSAAHSGNGGSGGGIGANGSDGETAAGGGGGGRISSGSGTTSGGKGGSGICILRYHSIPTI